MTRLLQTLRSRLMLLVVLMTTTGLALPAVAGDVANSGLAVGANGTAVLLQEGLTHTYSHCMGKL